LSLDTDTERVCYIANIGDARAVLVYKDDKVMRLTKDDKANDPMEKRRVEKAGGRISGNRVEASLAVTRAFGDLELRDFVRVTIA
jgi:serine/threonine protein phosphatase PrpC